METNGGKRQETEKRKADTYLAGFCYLTSSIVRLFIQETFGSGGECAHWMEKLRE